ncbi:MAG TPA: S-methyl-5-thioribose-1-phosphate isomerase [Bacillota bacterium]|nr:S-methyl-5-thioribose-1-phosphate isomerase [Bacillota bacterium]HNT03388.1 S-methyl-5-thioribose-1-phosphate isomerase [Bacillota bacterium]HOH89148.1 S-methyl-5-thioribose-1-phosphate isomerase [Bacillota bacterium]HPX69482.1 S-methyl-5-thioribose-1-phosphate isomerase [Bacillota bacterium]HQA66245.1 S-methyl-5-thioribose-1-phosphate isomerase [Bacillota bacterium]
MKKIFEAMRSVKWENNELIILDQTKLPDTTEFIKLDKAEDVWDAILHLKVRGAPAIGIAAAYGLCVAMRDTGAKSHEEFMTELKKNSQYLASSRPTAVNLFWALRRMERAAFDNKNKTVEELKEILIREANAIRDEDESMCRAIGENALTLFHDGMTVLTHCNAGGLATAMYGTALAPIYLAKEKGWDIKVFADETRPLLQGARLTAWELMQAGVDVTLICDNMAAAVMAKGLIDAVIVGCDRVAANGDTANKIGTYGLAVLAKAHNIPFYTAGPTSTIDIETPSGNEIPIEERKPDEITCGLGRRTAPLGVKTYNPAFDVTPHELITAIITEKGVVRQPYDEGIRKLFE